MKRNFLLVLLLIGIILGRERQYVFDLETYSTKKEVPRLFFNDKPLKFHDFNQVIHQRHIMSQPFTI